jgi:hypothetical protein
MPTIELVPAVTLSQLATPALRNFVGVQPAVSSPASRTRPVVGYRLSPAFAWPHLSSQFAVNIDEKW